MVTKIYEKDDINSIVTLLNEGKVVAFPTDTVYGLAVIYENEEALDALKKSKGRPENKPIPTMVASIEQMKKIAYIDEKAKCLVDAFMPGGFTMILKKKENLPDYITNGLDTIGIRMPDDEFILNLIRLCDKPLLVTSANLSGLQPGNTTEEVLEQLDGRIDAIVKGKPKGTMASTIVDMSTPKVKIIRDGYITKEQIMEVINKYQNNIEK